MRMCVSFSPPLFGPTSELMVFWTISCFIFLSAALVFRGPQEQLHFLYQGSAVSFLCCSCAVSPQAFDVTHELKIKRHGTQADSGCFSRRRRFRPVILFLMGSVKQAGWSSGAYLSSEELLGNQLDSDWNVVNHTNHRETLNYGCFHFFGSTEWQRVTRRGAFAVFV